MNPRHSSFSRRFDRREMTLSRAARARSRVRELTDLARELQRCSNTRIAALSDQAVRRDTNDLSQTKRTRAARR